jgi:hypothetical protein
MDILKKIKNYNKKKIKLFSKKINLEDTYKYKINKEKLIIINENNKKILTADFSFFGIINNNNFWIWGTSIPGTNTKITNSISKIKNLSYLFENNKNKQILFYHRFLTNDVVLINDRKQIDWINYLINYLNDSEIFINFDNSKNNLQFITIDKINQLYV